jgi:hypothetical protein
VKYSMSFISNRAGPLAGLFALLLAVSMVVLIPAPAQAASYGPVSIKLRPSGKCLDNYRGSSADYNMIQQWDCVPGNGSQKWYFDWTDVGGSGSARIRNADTGKCIARAEFGPYNGMRVVQLPCNLVSEQTVWRGRQVYEGNPSPDYYLMGNIGTNHCLDVPQGSRANGVPIQIWTCVSGNWQQHTTW